MDTPRSHGDGPLEGPPGLVELGEGIAPVVPRVVGQLDQDQARGIEQVGEPGVDGEPLLVPRERLLQLGPGILAPGPDAPGQVLVELPFVEVAQDVAGIARPDLVQHAAGLLQVSLRIRAAWMRGAQEVRVHEVDPGVQLALVQPDGQAVGVDRPAEHGQ